MSDQKPPYLKMRVEAQDCNGGFVFELWRNECGDKVCSISGLPFDTVRCALNLYDEIEKHSQFQHVLNNLKN